MSRFSVLNKDQPKSRFSVLSKTPELRMPTEPSIKDKARKFIFQDLPQTLGFQRTQEESTALFENSYAEAKAITESTRKESLGYYKHAEWKAKQKGQKLSIGFDEYFEKVKQKRTPELQKAIAANWDDYVKQQHGLLTHAKRNELALNLGIAAAFGYGAGAAVGAGGLAKAGHLGLGIAKFVGTREVLKRTAFPAVEAGRKALAGEEYKYKPIGFSEAIGIEKGTAGAVVGTIADFAITGGALRGTERAITKQALMRGINQVVTKGVKAGMKVNLNPKTGKFDIPKEVFDKWVKGTPSEKAVAFYLKAKGWQPKLKGVKAPATPVEPASRFSVLGKPPVQAKQPKFVQPTLQPMAGGQVNPQDIAKVKTYLQTKGYEMKNLKDINILNQDVTIKDIHGQTVNLKKGENIFEYEVADKSGKTKYVIKDGRHVIVDKKNLTILEQKGTMAGTPFAPKTAIEQPLIEEAKKYKSAEEFIGGLEGQGKIVYHGTNQEFDIFDKDLKGQDIKAESAKEGYWFTNSKEEAQDYADYSAKRNVPNQVKHEKKVESLLKRIENAERIRNFDLSEKLTLEVEELEVSAIQAEPSGQRIIDVVLDMKNPLIIDASQEKFASMKEMIKAIKKAKQQGNDGIIFENISDAPTLGESTTQYVVFDKSQIKTKQQLSNIWQEAQAIKPIQPKAGGQVPPQPPAEGVAPEPEENLPQLFEKQKDIWFGQKDVRVLQSKNEQARLQQGILLALGKQRYDLEAQNIDKAIHLYIDTKRNPAHIKEYYNKLSLNDQKLVDLSQNLPPQVKAIADQIEQSYKQIGLEALEADVIRNVLDNYAARVWDIEGKPPTQKYRKFGTTTRHAKARKFETIIEGMAKGYKLKTQGATSNLQVLKEEIVKTIEDKRFVKSLQKIKTIDGEPLLTTKQLEGYVKIEHPNFKVWGHAGLAPETEASGQVYGKNFFRTEEGTLFERRDLYAPKKQADNLNKILGASKLQHPSIKAITKANAIIKSWILQSSFFHHLAFMRSYYLGTNHKKWSEMNVSQAYKEGLESIKQENPLVMQGVKNGLTLGVKQDWNEELVREKTKIGKLLDTWKVSRVVKDKIVQLRNDHVEFLFGNLGAGLKAKSYLIEMRNMMKRYPNRSSDDLSKMVANLINDDFGGLHLQRMGRDQTIQHIFRVFALAPDWCVPSDTRAMTKTGWKYHHELRVGVDEILAFNPDTRKYQWSNLNDKYENKNFNSDIVSIDNHSRKIIMTPEHKCYVYNNSKKSYEVVLAKDINTSHSIPTCADFDYSKDKLFNDEFIHLVGWVVTDGYFKKNKNKLSNGEYKTYLYAKITQAKPTMVEHLKSLGLKYSVDYSMMEHDGIVSNYPKYTFNIPLEINDIMLSEKINNGLSWEFLSKLTKEQLEILYDAMMLGDGTGQNRFCGKEKEIFFMTLIQTMLGKPSTFYKQEENCWRTRIVMRNNIGCQNKVKKKYKGTIWCPSVDTGFWLAEREGLMFITGNTESNIRTMVKAFRTGDKAEQGLYRRFWAGIFTKGALLGVLANILMSSIDEDDKETKGTIQRFFRNYKRAWKEGRFRWMGTDITPIYKAITRKLGKEPKERRKYFSVLGHFQDPVKFVVHPIRSAKHKGSVVFKFFQEGLTGTDWRGKKFTTFKELTGQDKEKGLYETTRKGKYKEGDPKWGKLKGQTVKWDFKGGGAIGYEQLPSFILSQIKSMQPVQAQNLMSWMAGEMEGFDAFAKSLGLRVATTYEQKKKKESKIKKKPSRFSVMKNPTKSKKTKTVTFEASETKGKKTSRFRVLK